MTSYGPSDFRMLATERLVEEIKQDEGFRGKPYLDTRNMPTIGYGTLLPITKEGGELLLRLRLKEKEQRLVRRLAEIGIDLLKQPEEVKSALLNMAYQMGVGDVMEFKRTLMAVKAGDYKTAQAEMLDSDWARQTPNRAERVANLMASAKA